MKPVIGVTANYSSEQGVASVPMTYIRSVLEAGGTPVLIPVMKKERASELLSVIDGLIIPGGVDIDPRYYNERPIMQLGKVNPLLDDLEINLVKEALGTGLPILGICRGAQVLAVAAGGTLIQDLGAQVGGVLKHRQEAPRWYGTHEVVIEEGSLLERIFEVRRLWVNSFHHQAVKNPGDGMRVTAKALDGITEGAEAGSGFKVALQWHPEGMWEADRVFLRPFQALVRAAKGETI